MNRRGKHPVQEGSTSDTRGMALLEALVASAVLGIGLAGATRLTLHTLQTASDTRQYTLATTLAVDAMECLQSGRALCKMDQTITLQGTAYTVKSQLSLRSGLALDDIQVQVKWPALGQIQNHGKDESVTPTTPRIGQMVLHGSRDHVPVWVGVSLE